MRVLWLGYLAALTWLLVDRDPLQIVRSQETVFSLIRLLLPLTHVAAFSVLALLTVAARWPLPHWLAVTLLIVYGLATEFLQGFISTRQLDPVDILQNLAGIAIGCAMGWTIARLWTMVQDRTRDSGEGQKPLDAWDVLACVQSLERSRERAG